MIFKIKWLHNGFIQTYKLLTEAEEVEINTNYQKYLTLVKEADKKEFTKHNKIKSKQGEIWYNSPLHKALISSVNGIGTLILPPHQGGEHQFEIQSS